MGLTLSLASMVILATVALAQPPDGPPEHHGRRPFGMRGQSPFENPPRAKDEAEAGILKTLEEIWKTQGHRMNVPDSDGRLLMALGIVLAFWNRNDAVLTGSQQNTSELEI